MRKESLCWDCKNATGNCPWSRDFSPVNGWETIQDEHHCMVLSCPLFEHTDRYYLTIKQVEKIIGKSIYQKPKKLVKEWLLEKGYRAEYIASDNKWVAKREEET